MKRRLLKLRNSFKPYYEIVLSNYNLTDNSKPIKGFKIVRCYNFETVVKYQLGKRYINHKFVNFETFVKRTLLL